MAAQAKKYQPLVLLPAAVAFMLTLIVVVRLTTSRPTVVGVSPLLRTALTVMRSPGW